MSTDVEGAPTGSEPKPGPGRPLRVLLAACGALLVLLLLRFPPQHSMGWDESMHAALPATRLAAALREGDSEVFTRTWMDCEQYPFVYPFVLAAAQSTGWEGEDGLRGASVLLYAFAVFWIALIAGELAGGRRRALAAALLAAGLAATSPMAQAFARTLFLEVPFLAVAGATLCLWVLRRRPGAHAFWDAAAGLAATLAFFTKFNYGGLLLAGLALDELLQWVRAARKGTFSNQLTRSSIVAAPLVLGLAWWFVLPWPGGANDAASHRAALLGFLQGNLEMASTPPARKFLHLAAYLAPAPATALLLAIGVFLGALRAWRDPGARACLLVLLALALPTAWHPFHLERFWLPLGAALWPLAALGLVRLVVPATGEVRLAFLRGALLLALLAASTISAPRQSLALASRLGLVPEGADTVALQVFEGWNGEISQRTIPTAGLLRSEMDALLDLVTEELGPDERFAWLGLSSELSPAVLALGLYARGGSTTRLLRSDLTAIDIVPVPGAPEPDWDLEAFRAWTRGFDVIFFTDPPDVKDRANRRSVRERWQRPLAQHLGFEMRRLGVVPVERGDGEPHEVGLFAARSLR